MGRDHLQDERAQDDQVRVGMRRLLRAENGFTLTEVMVSIMVMIMVMFALYSIFDMSLRIYAFGNDKVEAVDNARIGLEKAAREIRAAHAVDKAAGRTHLFWNPSFPLAPPASATMPTASRITFGNDLNGNRVVDASEEITYRLSASGPPYKLERVAGGTASPVVDYVKAGGLKFTYLKKDGTALSASEMASASNEFLIAVVRIQLTINVDGREQTLTTDVQLRNRG